MPSLFSAGLMVTDGCHRDGGSTRRARGKGYMEQGLEGLAERGVLWTDRLLLVKGMGLSSRRFCRYCKWWLAYGNGRGVG